MRRFKHIRKLKPDRPQKYIKIDPRTTIEVDIDIPDDQARSNYLNKTKDHSPINRQGDLNEFVRGISFFR